MGSPQKNDPINIKNEGEVEEYFEVSINTLIIINLIESTISTCKGKLDDG